MAIATAAELPQVVSLASFYYAYVFSRLSPPFYAVGARDFECER
jgi:hypothetical protein